MTRKTLSRISLISYLILTLTSLGFAIYFFILGLTSPSEGWEGLGRAFAIIFGLICGAYTIFTLIPTILKVLDLRMEKDIFTVLCIFFDVLMIGAHTFLAATVLGESNEVFATVTVIAILALSLLSLVCNILRLKAKC